MYIVRPVGERRLTRLLVRGSLVGLALIVPLAGCGSDDDGGDGEDGSSTEISGTYVGDTQDKEAFVAIVGPPPEGGGGGESEVLVCDATRFCASLPATIDGTSLEAKSGDGDAKADGELSDDAVDGSVDLPGDKSSRYKADAATAAAGVYDLTVSKEGKLRGTSESGVALTGQSSLPEPGPGTLKLADGTRLEFEATENPDAESMDLEAGQVRLIVLPSGELRGAGRSTGSDGGDASYFFLRSSG